MLEFEEYKAKLNAAKPALEVLRGALKLEAAQKEIEELEAASEREGFWNDVEASQKVQKRLKVLKSKCENYQKLCTAWDDMMVLCEMAIEEGDDSLLEEWTVFSIGASPKRSKPRYADTWPSDLRKSTWTPTTTPIPISRYGGWQSPFLKSTGSDPCA